MDGGWGVEDQGGDGEVAAEHRLELLLEALQLAPGGAGGECPPYGCCVSRADKDAPLHFKELGHRLAFNGVLRIRGCE